MSLSRKNYEAVAAIVAGTLPARPHASSSFYVRGYAAGVEDLAEKLADYFASDNERFDRDRFLKACGVRECPACGRRTECVGHPCADCRAAYERVGRFLRRRNKASDNDSVRAHPADAPTPRS